MSEPARYCAFCERAIWPIMKTCATCGVESVDQRATRRQFCSDACKQKAWRIRTGRQKPAVERRNPVPAGTPPKPASSRARCHKSAAACGSVTCKQHGAV